MKKLLRSFLLVAVLGFFVPMMSTSCSTPPSARVQTMQILGVLGSSAKVGMDSATTLLKQGSITVVQYQKVADFYDTKWQPAYALAVSAAQADVNSIASPAITELAMQFLALIAQLTAPKPQP